jgi:hypothetical protein
MVHAQLDPTAGALSARRLVRSPPDTLRCAARCCKVGSYSVENSNFVLSLGTGLSREWNVRLAPRFFCLLHSVDFRSSLPVGRLMSQRNRRQEGRPDKQADQHQTAEYHEPYCIKIKVGHAALKARRLPHNQTTAERGISSLPNIRELADASRAAAGAVCQDAASGASL